MAKTPKKRGKLTRSCASMQAHMGLLDRYPQFRNNQSRLHQLTNTYILSGAARRAARAAPKRIQVVVHVVFNTDNENISDDQIMSQMDVLNADFSIKNGDLSNIPEPFKDLLGNPNLKFSLADTDPMGNPTHGITRQQTTRNSFSHDQDPVKFSASGGTDAWDTQRYLNIWVCSLDDGLLGYAQFPGGPEDTDGVVILNSAFGTQGMAQAPFDKGRTTTHEVGHYLNLSHIWGNSLVANCSDSDFVDDTPNQFGPNFGTPQFPAVSCENQPEGDMFMNYMDYVNDEAMVMFTHGQVARMQAALEEARKDLWRI
ncbi:MAG: zinc metalloprotease [Desulfobacterales bacterium]